MESSNQEEEEGNKKVTEVKTFTVPFALEEIKKNITIHTSTPKQPSKEQLINQAFRFHSQGNILKAKKYYQQIINQECNDHRVFSNYGVILTGLGKLKKAEISLRKAIKLKPNYAEAHSNLGNLLNDLNKLKEAESSYQKAIQIKPDYAEAHFNLGITFNGLGKLQEAEESYRKAIQIKPDYAEAHSNLGNLLNALNKLKEAESSYRKAIEIKPDYTKAYFNLGITLNGLRKLQGAENSYRKAIEIQPDYAEAHYNLGVILHDIGKLEEAEYSTRKAIKLKPDYANGHSNLGNILVDLGKIYDAINHYKKAIQLNDNSSNTKSGLIKSKGLICDWSDQETQEHWLNEIGIKGTPVYPLGLFCYEDNPLNQLKRAENLYHKKYYKNSKYEPDFKNKKIHVGYFSADFRSHPMMYLMGSIFKIHDKSKFKIYLYSFVKKEDKYTKIARESGCIFRDIKELSDVEAVELARSDKLDIAIDRMGYVKGNRMNIFSYRVAPIQIHYMAYAGSLGANSIDYLIADNIIIPKEYERFYSEKILRMPNCYQCNDNTKEISKEAICRSDFNLPKKGFIFTCFCANKKITPSEFDIWMRLLKKINGSVLWLYQSNKYSADNLIKEAEKRNVDADRLVFAKKFSLDKHLARHVLGDLALDTFNYNGHTTTSDALWAGLPVLTKIGKSFASRVSASILTSIGLPELITYSKKEYEDKALSIARNPDKLIHLKTKLAKSRETSSLFNTELWTRDLESKLIELLK